VFLTGLPLTRTKSKNYFSLFVFLLYINKVDYILDQLHNMIIKSPLINEIEVGDNLAILFSTYFSSLYANARNELIFVVAIPQLELNVTPTEHKTN